jgi:transcriptional regulator with XRE-family HTH domain
LSTKVDRVVKMVNTKDSHEVTLKSLIESSGHTQESFAKNIGLSRSAITYYIAGQKLPRADHFFKMAKLLGVSPKTLAQSMGINTAGIPDDSPN